MKLIRFLEVNKFQLVFCWHSSTDTPNGSAKSFINNLHWSKSRNRELKDWKHLAFQHKSLCQCPDSFVAVTGKWESATRCGPDVAHGLEFVHHCSTAQSRTFVMNCEHVENFFSLCDFDPWPYVVEITPPRSPHVPNLVAVGSVVFDLPCGRTCIVRSAGLHGQQAWA